MRDDDDGGDVWLGSELDDEYCLWDETPDIAESHDTALLEWNAKCGGGSL